MKNLKLHQYGELVGILFLLASTATQMFYLEPLDRDIQWRLTAYTVQQSTQIQLQSQYDNQIALLKQLNAPAADLAAVEAKRDATLDKFRNSDADISDFMIAKEGVEDYLQIVVIVLFAVGSLLAGLGRTLDMLASRRVAEG
ncbi:MAG: hypothetical protein WC829_06015 [Hyphomicrobium sp.]|jgi:hypothetical protein